LSLSRSPSRRSAERVLTPARRVRQHRGGVAAPRRVLVATVRRRDPAADARRAAALTSAQVAASIEASVLQSSGKASRPPAAAQTALEAAVPPPAAPISEAAEIEELAHPTRSELAEEAVQPQLLPQLYVQAGHLMVPAPLRGSREVLVHQNTMADDEGLSRIRNDAELNHLRGLRLLVDFPVSESLHLNPALPANRRCARPWTVRFAADIAHAFYARFGEPLQVNSAARTVAYQRRLQRSNGNAAAVEGEAASPHLTGQAIDFGKRGMSEAELAWMRAMLLPLMSSGKIDVEEEFQQACFHISVYRSYLPPARKRGVARAEVAQLHRAE